MPNLSGSFSHPEPGRLLVTLTGTYYDGGYRDAGFPSGGSSNILVRAYIGLAGSYSYLEPIDRAAPTSVLELDYPGGLVVWQAGTETIDVIYPEGLYSFGFANIRMSINLIKR